MEWLCLSHELHNDKEFILTAVTRNRFAFQYVSDEMRNDKEVVLAAVTHFECAVRWAPEELKNDKEVVLAAMAQNVDALEDTRSIVER